MPTLRRLGLALAVTAVAAFGATASSCGGGGGGGTADLVLVSFNLPNIAGVPLNKPLVFTFSADVDATSVTPDTLRVVGTTGPFFETIYVDGNLVALLPQTPNRDDYADSGMAPATTYSVSLSIFPAASTIRSVDGRPLLSANSYTFTTLPFVSFIEPSRPFNHGVPPSLGGRSDDEGCMQNWDNSLYVPPPTGVQAGSLPGGRLLCLENAGAPRVILDECIPTHDQLAVGSPNAIQPGYIDLPAIIIRLNEPLDPLTVTPLTSAGLGVNVQLWRVGDTDGNPLPGNPEPIETNTPITTQSITQTEIILVPSAAVLQGTYLINLRPTIRDLPGNALSIADTPVLTGSPYAAIDAGLAGKVSPGYRIYFVTLQLPTTPQAFNESYASNLNEWGDNNSQATEPGVFTESVVATAPLSQLAGASLPNPALTLANTIGGVGQSTTANWNGAFRFLNLPNVDANADLDNGAGRLKATWRPYMGDGQDGVLDTTQTPYGPGADALTISTDVVSGASINGDGIYEFERVRIGPGDTLTVAGSNPLVILCRGDFVVEGSILMDGGAGGPGLDTDGTSLYTNPGAALTYGAGGLPGPGGGTGGRGGDAFGVVNTGLGETGAAPRRLEVKANTIDAFEAFPGVAGGTGGPAAAGTNQGGGGGGFGVAGSPGVDPSGTPGTNGGAAFGDPSFQRALADFLPDRGYSPNALISGGSGGGGGGVNDDGDSVRGNGDDGGGGGGGAGGAIMVIAFGQIQVTGTIQAQGGPGGSTYDQSNQLRAVGPDGDPDTSDDVIVGLIPGAVPSGAGGPGGGGSGGGIILIANGNLTVSGTLSAQGGPGGTSGDVDLDGGAGAVGRIALGTFAGGGSVSTVGSSISPAANTFSYVPTVDLASSGQTLWFDLSTPTAIFSPPFFTTNFGFLGTQGQTQGVTFDGILELQGADTLTPVPGGLTPPSAATGLTQWSSSESAVNTKRYVRYRWRMFAGASWPYTTLAMPAVLDVTIPFTR